MRTEPTLVALLSLVIVGFLAQVSARPQSVRPRTIAQAGHRQPPILQAGAPILPSLASSAGAPRRTADPAARTKPENDTHPQAPRQEAARPREAGRPAPTLAGSSAPGRLAGPVAAAAAPPSPAAAEPPPSTAARPATLAATMEPGEPPGAGASRVSRDPRGIRLPGIAGAVQGAGAKDPRGPIPEEKDSEPAPREQPPPPDEPPEPAIPPDEESLLTVTGPPAARPSELITYLVTARGVHHLAHAPLRLTFDPDVLEFQSATEGPLLASGGAGTVFLAKMSDQPGLLYIGISRMPGFAGVDGDGILCSVTFRAKAAGQSLIDSSGSRLLDRAADQVPFRRSDTHVTVN